MNLPDNYQTTYDSKTKIVVFYSLSAMLMLNYVCIIHVCSSQPIYSDIDSVSWPAAHTDADVKRLSDGAIQITSIDQCASLKLAANKHQFSVEYLCKVPREGGNKRQSVKVKVHDVGLDGKDAAHDALQRTKLNSEDNTGGDAAHSQVSNASREADRLQSGDKDCMHSDSIPYEYGSQSASAVSDISSSSSSVGCVYVWVVQHCSVDECPPNWRYPLQRALSITADALPHQSEGKGHGLPTSAEQNDGSKMVRRLSNM